MNAHINWMSRVDAYLDYRRSHGYKLTIDGSQLQSFARFADQAQAQEHLTVALATAWARTSKSQNAFTFARRLETLRGFARFCQREDPQTEIPPRGLLGSAHRRLVPHIYTEDELRQLLDTARVLEPRNGLRAASCWCIFGLLAASGLRISEALALTHKDIDLKAGTLHIQEAKFNKQRIVPLHSSVVEALVEYNQRRNRLTQRPICDKFFLRDDGKGVNQRGVRYALQCLCKQLGWQPRGDYPHHRLHDFRHTFIVHSVLNAYRQGSDIDRAVLALSNYVGHAKVSDTYWYFTGIPELMVIAAQRFEHYAQEVSQ